MRANYSSDVARRVCTIFLLAGFLMLGTGLLDAVHQHVHLLEHARAGAVDSGGGLIGSTESDCALCVQLHLPAISAGWVPLLVCLGLFVAFLTLVAPPLVPQRVLAQISCRGPPVL